MLETPRGCPETAYLERRKVMESVGGMELLKGLATKLRNGGDNSAAVIEQRLSDVFPYTLILRYGSELEAKRKLYIISKGVSIDAYSNGAIEIQLTVPTGWWSRLIGGDFSVLSKSEGDAVKAMSLEEQIGVAMKRAHSIPDENIWRPNDERWQIVF